MKPPWSSMPAHAGSEHAPHPRHGDRERGHAPAERPSPPTWRILVVDDSRVSRELMKVYLIARDVELIEAADGFEAVDLVRSHRPDLVLADMRMPRLDGLGLCTALRNDPAMAQVPVLILSAACDDPTEIRLRAAGAREVLRKPIAPQPLLAAVRRHLPLRRPARVRGERSEAGGGRAAT